MQKEQKRKSKKQYKMPVVLLLCLLLTLAFAAPAAATEQDPEKTVRVGWHEPPYFIRDDAGRRSGYTYEYLQKLSAYTGWNFEYVEGSWSELMQMLKNGEIDLMGNVSYTEERAGTILYASLPMGAEAYYLLVPPDSTEITSEDYSTLNGKRIGVAKGSIQSELLKEWLDSHGVRAELVEMTSQEEESLTLLGKAFDAFVTMDVHGDPGTAVPVWKIGSSDYFFAVSKSRGDLLTELNEAMNSLQDENKYYSEELHEKYLRNTETNLYLNDAEEAWLSEHGTIRVGYQDNYLAFCAKDPNTGELTGALKDYLDYASKVLENAELDFETVAFPTVGDAFEALKKGEVDCVFPANLSAYDSEMLEVVMTPALMKTEMDAVVRADEQKEFVRQKHVTVAVNRGNTNYEMFMAEHFPDWKIEYFENTSMALDAVAAGEADCVVISNYRFNNIAKQCEDLHLTTVYTGVDMDYSLAVRKGDTELYSILAKITDVVPVSTIHKALTYYSTEDAKVGLIDYIKDHLAVVLTGIMAVALLILLLLLRSIRAERKAMEEERVINALSRKVFVDALTSVRNKGAFVDYIEDMQEQLESGELSEFAIGVFDCDDLKSINDRFGHDKGDIYLKAASQLICRVFKHSPVFRIGGDEFAVILQNQDYESRDELVSQFDKAEFDICRTRKNQWEQVRIALGIAVYDPDLDDSVNDTARRADKIMYENKRTHKGRDQGEENK